MPYKLSAALYGHSLDVRALAVTSDGRIVSASRDKTAKVWKPNLHNAGFCEEQTLKGHSKFVSSVCVLPASEILPGGLILTGSNDNTICAFRNGETEPAFVLTGHTNAVCCLSASTNPKTPSIVLSSSWDQTAKVWCLGGGGGGGEALLTLSGHQAAVWSVLQLSGGHIVTASADKTIRTYTAEGQHQKTITGHTDCVRDLAVTQSPTEFLSCANDATIRKWNVLTGECLNTYYGHPHYIYSLSALPSGLVVSGGEDRSVMVWSQGGSQQESITLPAQSVWAVALLPNGDVVTGSSDGVVRVFSCEVSRQADEVTLAQFEEEIAALTRAASQEVGGVKVSELPGKEALLAAGKSDGQTKMVQEDGVATVYSWSAEQQQWLKVGTAMGAVGPNNPETGRTTFNGKEYDYVFSVDIEDGAPPLKLPYNNGEDPWHAAQAFIHRNNLNQQFLEQIANFIITNSKKPEPVVLNQAAGAATGYCDPFTGGARYIPEGVGATPATQQPLSNGNTSSKNDSGPTLFPQTTYLKFDAGNLELIKDKLLEFNKDPTRSVDNDSLESLLRLAESDVEPTNEALNTLQKLLEWPDNFLIPVLDLLRMCLRNSQPNRALSSPSTQRCNHLFGVLIRQLSSGAASNRALALRCVVNMMVHGGGEEAVGERRQQLLPLVEECIGGLAAVADGKSTHLQTALSTTLLNFVILAIKERDSTTQTHLVRMLQTLLPLLGNAEAQLRALVALGTLLSSAAGNDQLIASCLDAVTLDTLMGLSSKEEGGQGQVGKVALCSRQIVERFVV